MQISKPFETSPRFENYQREPPKPKLKFPSKRIYHDKFFTALYFMTLLGFLVTSYFGFKQALIAINEQQTLLPTNNSLLTNSNSHSSINNSEKSILIIKPLHIFYLFFTAIISGFLTSLAYLFIIKA